MKLYSLYHVCQGRKIGKCICVCICFKSASNYEVFFSICKGFKSWWYKNWNYTINWNDQFSFKIPERERGNKDKHEYIKLLEKWQNIINTKEKKIVKAHLRPLLLFYKYLYLQSYIKINISFMKTHIFPVGLWIWLIGTATKQKKR